MFGKKVLRKIHASWHVTTACFGIVFGVWLGDVLHLVAAVAIIGIICIMFAIWRRRAVLVVAAFIGGMLVGLGRAAPDQQAIAAYHELAGRHVQIAGTVLDDVDTNARKQAVLHVGKILYGEKGYPGKWSVTLDAAEARDVQRGDHIVVDGVLSEGFGAYAAVLGDASIVGLTREEPGHADLAVRNSFSEHISSVIDEPAASLGMGYLLGQKRGLPEHLIEALQIVGLTHIVVASGYNLTILVRLSRRLFQSVSKYASVFFSALLVGGFLAITGMSPSMTRAALVTGLSLWAWYFGRKFHPATILALAAAITVLINPSYVWGDLGWALSFAAFAGVMIIAPLMQAYFFGSEEPAFIQKILGETIAAQIATAPLILFAFGQFSNIALIANLVIVPFVPLAMLLVFLAGLGSYIAGGLADIIAWPAEVLLKIMIAIIDKTANVSWAQSQLQLNEIGLFVAYVVIIAICFYLWRKTRYRLYASSVIE